MVLGVYHLLCRFAAVDVRTTAVVRLEGKVSTH